MFINTKAIKFGKQDAKKSSYSGYFSSIDLSSIRVPNFFEVSCISLLRSIADLVLSKYAIIFGDNTVASSVIRDMIFLPSNIVNYRYSNEYGNSGIVYDEGFLIGGFTKFFMKIFLIQGFLVYRGDGFGFGKAVFYGKIANFISDPISKVFVVASYEKQSSNEHKETSYLDFFKNNCSFAWIVKACVGCLVMTAIATGINEYIVVKLGINKLLREKSTILQEYLLNKMSYLDSYIILDNTKSFYAKITENKDSFKGDAIYNIFGVLSAAIELFSKFIVYASNAYIIIPPARSAYDYTMAMLGGNYAMAQKTNENSVIPVDEQIDCEVELSGSNCDANLLL